jgi:hypothetical protein
VNPKLGIRQVYAIRIKKSVLSCYCWDKIEYVGGNPLAFLIKLLVLFLALLLLTFLEDHVVYTITQAKRHTK